MQNITDTSCLTRRHILHAQGNSKLSCDYPWDSGFTPGIIPAHLDYFWPWMGHSVILAAPDWLLALHGENHSLFLIQLCPAYIFRIESTDQHIHMSLYVASTLPSAPIVARDEVWGGLYVKSVCQHC